MFLHVDILQHGNEPTRGYAHTWTIFRRRKILRIAGSLTTHGLAKMVQGKIKKFKIPVDNSIENFLKDISIKKNEYVYGCGAEDIDNINLTADSIISFFNFINESYSNLLLLLCQEGFDHVLNYLRICDNFNDEEQEKVFACFTILTEKSVDIFKNYFKCVEKCNKEYEWNNGTEILRMIINENNNIVNVVIQCLEENYIEYSVSEKKKKFTFFEINEIIISYFNALTFVYINIFNSYYNKNFCKQQNTEIIVSVQRGRKKIKKDNEEETNTALKNVNELLNNIILLVSNINFDILYTQINIAVVDLYLQFFLNIYSINQENNNTFHMAVYHDHISLIIGTLLRLYIKRENIHFSALVDKHSGEKDSFPDGGSNGRPERRGNGESEEETHINEEQLGGEKMKKKNDENFLNDQFHSFSFTYIFLNCCKKCTNVNICDALLRVRGTDIPKIIIKEFVDYIKENSLLYLNLSVQIHAQNEIVNVLNFLEYISKNLSFHLLSFLKDLVDMLGIDIYYIRKSIFEMFKNFITLAKACEEVKETGNDGRDNANGKLNAYWGGEEFYCDDEGEDSDDAVEAEGTGEDDDDSSDFFTEDDLDKDFSGDEFTKKRGGKKKKENEKGKKSKSVSKKNSKEKNKKGEKNSINLQKQKRRRNKMKIFLKSHPLNISTSVISTTYKDIIHKIILEDIPFLQLCFKECLKNRAFIMNVLMSRQHDSKLHVRCHLLKVLQELIENNFIPLNYYNNLCLICSERINDKSPLVRQRAFSLLSCIASDVVKNKYVIPLNTLRIKKELNSLNKRKDKLEMGQNGLMNQEEKTKVTTTGGNRKKRINLSDSDDDDEGDGEARRGSIHCRGTDGESDMDNTPPPSIGNKGEHNNYHSKYDLLIKMYNEVLFISIIVDECVDICFKLLYSVVEADQKSSIRFLILAHICGNKKAEEQMNKVWSLIFSNNNSIVEIIMTEFINVNICCDDYRISVFRLINIILNSKIKDLSCIEKIMECLLMQEKTNISISKLLDELFNITFVDTFSEKKNLIIKEGALLLMKILCSSIHTVNVKKGKKEQHFHFSNKRKHLIILFINQYKDNLYFINLLIVILKYNKTNKIIQSLLIILFNLVFDNMVGDETNTDANCCVNIDIGNYVGDNFLDDGRNMWFKCCQSMVESMYEHFDDFLLIFTTKIKSILNLLLCSNKTANDNSTRSSDSMGCKLRKIETKEGDNSNKISCFTLTKFIFVSGHLGLYTYIYAEKMQNKLKKIASKDENNYGMCTKEEKDREYFDYVVENMIVCNNLLGKKIIPIIFLILNNPENFFKECLLNSEEKGNKNERGYRYLHKDEQTKEKIYMHYEVYLLVLVSLLTLCKFSIISQKFCQNIICDSKVSIIQLIVSIITEEKNQIFEKKGKEFLPCDRKNGINSQTKDDKELYKKEANNFEEFDFYTNDEENDNMEENAHCEDYLSGQNEKGEDLKVKYSGGPKCQELPQQDGHNAKGILYKTISNVRKMLLISYADLLYRHPNLLEPYNKHIFKVLNDKDINMRRTAVSVFTHLFMTDTVKAKNILLVHMMYLTVDEDEKISSGSKSFFYELDRKSHITLVNNICDMISVLARNERKLKYNTNKEILQFLLTFIKKSKYNETLVEKIFKKMKEVNINKSETLHLYMQVFLNIHIDEKVLSKINKCFPLIRYIIRENQYILNNFVLICKKATEKKRGRPTEDVQQQPNGTNNDKGNNEKTDNDKSENKMRELAEDILGKIESTTNKSKNVSNLSHISNEAVKEVKNKSENDPNGNEEDVHKNEETLRSDEE
ncbi:condensin complex subunit 1, putative [Plasmodium ovale]|uniref:Condensin complex subunit 1 C-terminal domain-containing protein n=2 Tax=Plasmodium ovale TaxID=36330 RepID=A0A1A8W4X7_PLAOA|nr:conserved Plasmodium protein, unknown function [Plasmodium ovale curtisi]SBS97829.1 conserved Plasmodium protein, unknown function [Plasmodium ovale curtisi]SCP06378.1 condensin complex subunit 1, putative [Plasmodium ovale]